MQWIEYLWPIYNLWNSHSVSLYLISFYQSTLFPFLIFALKQCIMRFEQLHQVQWNITIITMFRQTRFKRSHSKQIQLLTRTRRKMQRQRWPCTSSARKWKITSRFWYVLDVKPWSYRRRRITKLWVVIPRCWWLWRDVKQWECRIICIYMKSGIPIYVCHAENYDNQHLSA